MPLQYPYADAYLAQHVTPDRETRASSDVAALGTLPDEWVQRLTIVRAYIITCLESTKSTEDLFSAKLAGYRKEYAELIPQARAAQAAAEIEAGAAPTGGGSVFGVDLQRG